MIAQARTGSKGIGMTGFRISPLARMNGMLFGSPNFRRANGIVEARFDILGSLAKKTRSLFGKGNDVPVFVCDRKGGKYSNRLPKIWLSEKVSNTSRDSGRVMVECYPSSPDRMGERALELGDRYLGEGRLLDAKDAQVAVDCYKAAEILYLHAVRRGNRLAASRLREIYAKDLCNGDYWKDNMESRARHCKRGVGRWRLGRS